MKTRMVREGFFLNENLAQCSFEARLLFIGLWCLADREGKVEDRPLKIAAQIFPYEHHGINCDDLLNSLQEHGFILRYEINHARFLIINNFLKHQSIHPNEGQSRLPSPEGVEILMPEKRQTIIYKSANERKQEREAEVFRIAAENDQKREKMKKLN